MPRPDERGSEAEVQHFASLNGYGLTKLFDDGARFASVAPQMFTAAIIAGPWSERHIGYRQRWCYHTPLAAHAALLVWDGTGSPVGWHREVHTGMRVSETGNEFDGFGKQVSGPGVVYWYP